MASGAQALALLLLTCAVSVRPAASGLTPDQESWLDSVRFGNVSSKWPSLTQQQTKELRSNADQFMAQVWPVNFPWNQAVEVWYAEKNMSSKVVYYDDCGDSAAWTGLYLASLAHQYNATWSNSTLDRLEAILRTIYSMTVCTGKKGFLPRMYGLATDPAYFAYYNDNPRHYACVSPMEEFVWLGDTSRDMYLGIAFGLANVWHFVNDAGTKALTQEVAESILDDLIKEHFWIVSPEGSVTNPVPGFSAVLRRLALTVNPKKYADQKEGYETDFLLIVLFDGFAMTDKWASGYFVNELNLEVMYILTLLDREDEERVKILQDAFAKAVITNADHYQPGYEGPEGFAAFFLSALPNSSKADIPKGVLQGGLMDYPPPPDWGRYVDQSNNPEYEPHKNADQSEFALRVRDRPSDTYLWQRAPTKLKGGDKGPVQYPHIDFLLPYWMGRSSGFIGAP